MTAPTPDSPAARHAAWVKLDPELAEWPGKDEFQYPIFAEDDPIGDQMAHYIVENDVPALLDALAAVTAERDQARQMLEDAKARL
jgi:hypothetical protein